MVGAALPPAAAASCASLSSLGKRPTCEARKDCHWCSTMFVECQPKAAKCQPASAALSNSTGTAATAGRGLNCSDGLLDKSRTCCCDTHCGTCGGTSCQNHPGGRDKCCCSVIRANGRRCDREPAPCTMPPAPPAPPPPPLRPAHTVNPKRGFVADSTNCDDAVLLNASGWFYNYNLWNPYRVQSGQRKSGGNCTQALSTGRIDARFTPMNWCLSGMKERPAPTVNASYFMGSAPGGAPGAATQTPTHTPTHARTTWARRRFDTLTGRVRQTHRRTGTQMVRQAQAHTPTQAQRQPLGETEGETRVL